MSPKRKHWLKYRQYSPGDLAQARKALEEVRDGAPILEAIRHHPIRGRHLSKSALVAAYNQLVTQGEWQSDPALLARIRLKPVRTLSGVTTITVLTKPHPCPGTCIFCPEEQLMPKSYLSDEPGAMRAVEYAFDPYDQVEARLKALEIVGHPTEKIELLILGGTWSAYHRDYQEWFVKRCFEALNQTAKDDQTSTPTLAEAHNRNETAQHRNVGLAIETRPDKINPEELAWLRYLGTTKIQMGAQSLDDSILKLNQRGHTLAETHLAVAWLRAAGFKIVLHWMPNLLGATLESDHTDFIRLWEGLCPDEIKIYPTQLLENTRLFTHWQRGEYLPYSMEELVALIADLKPTIPRYCRVNRVIRDIPSTHVVAGNKRTSLRQDIHIEMRRRGTRCQCIRCREVRGKIVDIHSLKFEDLTYHPDGAEEHFLSFFTPDDQIAGFLRLSLPTEASPETGLKDLDSAAIIREVHIYGQSLPMGEEQQGAAQHAGLGTRLVEAAERTANAAGFRRIAVISAIGTRHYYLGRGFKRGELYLVKDIP